MQVYNEQIFDLLEDAPLGPGQHRPALRLKEDNQGRVLVGGLTEVSMLLKIEISVPELCSEIAECGLGN